MYNKFVSCYYVRVGKMIFPAAQQEQQAQAAAAENTGRRRQAQQQAHSQQANHRAQVGSWTTTYNLESNFNFTVRMTRK